MGDHKDLSRRRVLELLGTSGLAGLAGCGQQQATETPTRTASPTRSPTETLTATEAQTDTQTPERDWTVDPLEHDKLIGAAYYVWYGESRYWQNGYRGTPILGEYDSRDENVISPTSRVVGFFLGFL